jgi:hypothetical protein
LSNYTPITDFAAKDALVTGNPSKVASGTQIQAEFDAIETAIATKEDVAEKGQANGYAELDGSGDVPSAQISQASVTQHQAALTILETQITDGAVLARVAGNETISGAWNFSGTAPTIGGSTIWRAANDGSGSGLDADTVDGSHASAFAAASHAHSTSDITSGTFADARIASSNVTQHRLALILAVATIQSDPGGTPSGSPGQLFLYY